MSSRDSSPQRGAVAEQLAVEYLQTQGVLVLARNLRCKAGEIDVVGLDGDVLAIIEVRQRASTRFGGALASVTQRKQHKIIRAARYFLRRQPHWGDRAMRFDVLGLQGLPGGPHRLAWTKDAFRAT